MKLYHRISLIISGLCVGSWVAIYLGYAAPGARDGGGPNPLGLLLFLSVWLVGALLVHSTLVSTWLATSKGDADRVREGSRGLKIQAALWVVLALCVWPWMHT